MSVREKVRLWQSKSFKREPDPLLATNLKRSASAPTTTKLIQKHSMPQHLIEHRSTIGKRKSLTLSVIFENETEDSSTSESEEKDQLNSLPNEDVEDAPTEFALDDFEMEFINIAFAQEALQEVIDALNQKSTEARNSLGLNDENIDELENSANEETRELSLADRASNQPTIKGTNGKTAQTSDMKKCSSDYNRTENAPFLTLKGETKARQKGEDKHATMSSSCRELVDEETKVMKCLNDAISNDRERKNGSTNTENTITCKINLEVPGNKKHENPMDALNEILEIVKGSYDKQVRYELPARIEEIKKLINAPIKTSVPQMQLAPPPPPPPLPPPPPMETPNPLRLIKRGAKPSLSQISIVKDAVTDNVELRVKRAAVPGMEMMNQLQNALRKRKNRESLKKKYEYLAKS